MEKRIVVWLAVLISLMIYSCTGEAEDTPTEPGSEFESLALEKEATSVTGVRNHPDIVAMRPYYDLVIQDQDGWEIMLNLRKRRLVDRGSYDSIYTYYGLLVYKLSSYTIAGFATAQFDQRTGMFAVAAKDSAWNRGNIQYQLQMNNDTPTASGETFYNLPGSYWYYKWPFRMNKLRARLIQGRVKGFTTFPL